ncbi:MAG: hypothetical protein K5900_14445 [Butyrivibrio sp.]|nr:hypothetical protein [Butyrivibrio sp.]
MNFFLIYVQKESPGTYQNYSLLTISCFDTSPVTDMSM